MLARSAARKGQQRQETPHCLSGMPIWANSPRAALPGFTLRQTQSVAEAGNSRHFREPLADRKNSSI